MSSTFKLDKDKARGVLLREGMLDPLGVDHLLRDFPEIHEPLAGAVSRWLDDQTIEDVSVDGLSIQELMARRRSHFLVAVKELNMLLDDVLPEEKRKRWRALLEKPVFFE